MHVSAALPRLGALAKAYSHIERLTCRMGHAQFGEDIEDVLEAMIGSAAEEHEGGRAPDDRIQWPQLKSIAAEGLPKPIDASVVRPIVLKLRKPGSSVHTLLLPKACFDEGDVEGLKNIIKIEEVQEEWPNPYEHQWFD